MDNNYNSTQQMSTLKEYIKALVFDCNSILDDVPDIVNFIDQMETLKTEDPTYSKPYQSLNELKQIVIQFVNERWSPKLQPL